METIINYNEEEDFASVYTCSRTMKNKLARYAEEYPDECRLVKEYPDMIAVEYTVPKKRVKISLPRKISDEQRVAMSEKARILSQLKQAS